MVLGYRVKDDGLLALSYTRQQPEFDTSLTGGGGQSFDVDVGYVQFGGELELHLKRRWVPFIGLTIGASHFSPRNGGSSDCFAAAVALFCAPFARLRVSHQLPLPL